MSTYNWSVEIGGTLGDGSEDNAPVQYPRSDLNRGQSDNNKGAASRGDNVLDAVALNTTGNINVPGSTADVDYKVGPYPSVEEVGGVDEGDGASR